MELGAKSAAEGCVEIKQGEGMKWLNMIVCGFVALCGGMAYAETCVPTVFNVSYSCNGGTVSGGLPSNTTAEYGKNFTPTVMTESMCNPPSGKTFGGSVIIVDGTEVAYSISPTARAFVFNYVSDITIAPRWVGVATADMLRVNVEDDARTYTSDAGTARGNWTANFWYGIVKGQSRCSNIKPNNTAPGYYTGIVAPDQSGVESSTSGMYCYCKMTSPSLSGSLWVLRNYRGSASDCANTCADGCGTYVQRSEQMRASVFSAAMN